MGEIQSLARGLKILDKIANANRSISITDLAQQMSLEKSTVSRLVQTLVHLDYVQQEAGSRRYVIGKRLHKISLALLNRMPVREKAKPYLYRLVQDTGECAHTAIYSNGRALFVDDVESEISTLRVVGGIGRLLPLHCTAVGKALLAFSDLPLPEGLEMRTARTFTDPISLTEHLAEIRAQGYAVDDEENDLGVRCIAAPVYDYMGSTIAAIGISGPTVRITEGRLFDLAQTVIQASIGLSTDLGYITSREPVRGSIFDRATVLDPIE